jgi:hypothetical protein
MENRGSRLAARFRKAVTEQADARKRAEDEASRARDEGQRARRELLTDLVAFARELGLLQVQHDGEGLTLRYRERFLHFEPEGDHDRLRIELEGAGDEEHALQRQPELGFRWVYIRKRRLREDRVPLFDAGLEHLLVHGLGLPPPAEGASVPEAPRATGPVGKKL